MSREALHLDPEFAKSPRVTAGREVSEHVIESEEEAKREYASLPPDAGIVDRFLAKSKVVYLDKMGKLIGGALENEARYLEAEREYLLQHLQDTMDMLNNLEVMKMKMKSKNRRIVEG